MFRPRTVPGVLLFKNDKVYQYNNVKTQITKQDLLDFLSADLFKTEGVVYHEDTSQLLVEMTG